MIDLMSVSGVEVFGLLLDDFELVGVVIDGMGWVEVFLCDLVSYVDNFIVMMVGYLFEVGGKWFWLLLMVFVF